ncbi:hypothetical protein DR996_25680 [Vibrio owensii]|nr:hypothetical protein DR996_25680 [Vibrio owensii]
MTQQLNDIEQKFRDEEEALFAQCEEKCGTPISKMSLRNIRKAAKTMLASGAKINNSTIAAFIQNLDNSDLFEKTEKENVRLNINPLQIMQILRRLSPSM